MKPNPCPQSDTLISPPHKSQTHSRTLFRKKDILGWEELNWRQVTHFAHTTTYNRTTIFGCFATFDPGRWHSWSAVLVLF